MIDGIGRNIVCVKCFVFTGSFQLTTRVAFDDKGNIIKQRITLRRHSIIGDMQSRHSNAYAQLLIVFHFAIFASPRSLFRSRQFGQRVVVIDGMPFISKHPCRGPVLMIDGMSVWSKHHCRAHVVVIDGMSFWSKHPCRAHVVVFDGMCFSSMQPCRAHVVVDDGMSFSSMHPCRAHVVVFDGMSFWSMHPCIFHMLLQFSRHKGQLLFSCA